jgi:hypothetical protein
MSDLAEAHDRRRRVLYLIYKALHVPHLIVLLRR